MTDKGHRSVFMLTLIFWLFVDDGQAKTVSGFLTTNSAKETMGQYIAGFYFHGETAEIQYTVNMTNIGGASVYLYLDEDWQEAKETTNCLHKLQMARLNNLFENRTGRWSVTHFVRPRLWHLVYADAFTCDKGRPIIPLEQPVYISYEIKMLNPDSLGYPANHFGGDEAGLFRFYQILLITYFVLGCIYIPRVYETIKKGGPMDFVIRLLSAALCLQASAAVTILIHLRSYSIDGYGSPMFELLSELLDLTSHFVMLYMLLSLSLGWALGHSYRPTRTSLSKIRETSATRIVIFIGILQGMSFLWEQYEQQEQRMYHLHRSYAGISLAIARLLLAAIFMSHLRNVISSERSALKRDFYNSFTKCCMVWFLCSPLVVLMSLLLSPYLRFKLITTGVVLGQCIAVFMLYRLFLSRSLYWEVSALSSYLPLRMDKSFGSKYYS
ncbi:hypothetical protein LSH36_325g04073 [Paralvinella palmiformis]|uniref:Intimal thickness related receptor IRP domain-containing protein n=1 Tax=Paralvinella palmiformis TaxID=53620 RepID=A0AAD9JH63_9ANNE|nr:hypothetical protein LSH36_325g04073 [Paralvinella palmiformis]